MYDRELVHDLIGRIVKRLEALEKRIDAMGKSISDLDNSITNLETAIKNNPPQAPIDLTSEVSRIDAVTAQINAPLNSGTSVASTGTIPINTGNGSSNATTPS